jgi:ADP-ribosylation factor related protein 1
MFHLLSGLHTYLTRKDEFSLAIIGLDASGKTTFLEQVKHLYLPNQPAVDPAKIGPTVGQGGACVGR